MWIVHVLCRRARAGLAWVPGDSLDKRGQLRSIGAEYVPIARNSCTETLVLSNRLYLIRHGKPAAGWGEDDDPGLDAQGRAQAEAVATWLMEQPSHLRPVRVVSSPLRRCRETAEPFARALGVEIEIDPDVGEIPTPAGLVAADRPAWLREAMAATWADIRGDIDYEAWRGRVGAALRERPGTAVFSHFVAINAAVSALMGQDAVIAFRPDHTSVTMIESRDGRLVLLERGREATTQVL
jgi:broad specificity phosphatase PhoE